MKSVVFGASDVGRVRKHNEDAFIVDEDLSLYLVCDGMGGAAAGEVASHHCIKVVKREIGAKKDLLRRYAAEPTPELRPQVLRLVEHAIETACAEIWRLATADPVHKKGMGTTVAMMLVLGEVAVLAHVGDSRIYLLRQGEIHQLTEDHSLVAEQLRHGLITADQAEHSSLANVITRAVGTQEVVRVDTLHFELMPQDIYLLCSDGLTGYVPAEELGSVLATTPLEQCTKRLIALANERGGKDNITAVVLQPSVSSQADAEVNPSRKLATLHGIQLFSHLTYKELMNLLSIVNERCYGADETIIKENTCDDEFFVLLLGAAHVTKQGRKLATLASGDHFGEMCLLDDAPRSATITAADRCRVMVMRRGDLYPLLQREPILAVKVLWSFCEVLSDRLRDTSAELSGAQRKMESMLQASQLAPFVTNPGLDTVPTLPGIGLDPAAIGDHED